MVTGNNNNNNAVADNGITQFICVTPNCVSPAQDNGYCKPCNFIKDKGLEDYEKHHTSGGNGSSGDETESPRYEMRKGRKVLLCGYARERCDKAAFKGGLCYRHYKISHGRAPYDTRGRKKTAEEPGGYETPSFGEQQIYKESQDTHKVVSLNEVKKHLMSQIREQMRVHVKEIEWRLNEIKKFLDL